MTFATTETMLNTLSILSNPCGGYLYDIHNDGNHAQHLEHLIHCSEGFGYHTHNRIFAFSIVSAVVKVLDVTTTTAISGSRPQNVQRISAGQH